MGKLEQTAGIQNELVQTYRPIVNGAGLAGVGYFAFNALKRFFLSEGIEQSLMFTLAIVFGLASLAMWAWTRRERSAFQIELCCAIICFALLANTTIHMLVSFQPENLVYFAIMMPVFAMMTPNVKIAALWTLSCVICLISMVAWQMPDMVFEYLSICVAGALAALGASALVRGAVYNALTARNDALEGREDALRIAVEDTLTGLPNRRSFFEAFEQRRQDLVSDARAFVLILVDLDGFKPVNDVYGHGAGDELLQAVAKRLQATSPAGALTARLGGDEFAVLADFPQRRGDLQRMAARITTALCLPYTLDAGVVRISGSAGVFACDRPELDTSAMIERADHALYRAKNDRRGEVVVFTTQHETDLVNVHHVDRCLRSADLETELSLVFQPQYDLQNNRIAGFEALGRWNSAQLGPVAPSVFIEAAERTNEMCRVTRILLAKALKAFPHLPENMGMAINLSAHDLMSYAHVQSLVAMVRESGIDASRLEFEITETAMLDDTDMAGRSLAELQASGATIALDDFGSGYSNFSYLPQLKVSKLKVDRSFVQPLLRNPSAAKILRTLISLANTLNMICVVEGIERPEEMAYAKAFGARYLQGFLLAKPMPVEAIPAFLGTLPDWQARMETAMAAADLPFAADIDEPAAQKAVG